MARGVPYVAEGGTQRGLGRPLPRPSGPRPGDRRAGRSTSTGCATVSLRPTSARRETAASSSTAANPERPPPTLRHRPSKPARGRRESALRRWRGAAPCLHAPRWHISRLTSTPSMPSTSSRCRTGTPGTNMMATLALGARREPMTVPEEASSDAGRVAAAISFGALMGARGNSGVILSQVFRGMSEAVKGRKRINGLDLAHALAAGRVTAYAAVRQAGRGHHPDRHPGAPRRRPIASAEREHGHRDRADRDRRGRPNGRWPRTPSLLPILREAGVVDSRVVRRTLSAVPRARSCISSAGQSRRTAGARRWRRRHRRATLVAHADEGFGYETMFPC